MSENRTQRPINSIFKAEIRLGTVFAIRFYVMTKENARIRKTVKAEHGSIMLEYVIVLCGIGVALFVFMTRAFYSVTYGFGPLGQTIVAFYQRTLGGLSLPIP